MRRAPSGWLLAGAAALGLAGDAPRVHAEPDVRAPLSTATAPGFDPGRARLADDSVERRMLSALQASDAAAATQLGSAALPEADPESRGRILWLLQRAAATPEARTEALQALASAGHPLSKWGALELAETLREADPARALALLEPLRAGWGGALRARHLHALCRLKLGDEAGAERALRELLEELPLHSAGTTAALPLAELLAARDSTEARVEALELLRRVATRVPWSGAGKRAAQQAQQVLAGLPRAQQKELALPSVEDAFFEARAWLGTRADSTAERSLRALSARVADDPTLLCRAQLELGRALLQQRKRTEGAAWMGRLAQECGELEVKAWARYYAGRTEAQLGHPEQALVHFRALQQEAAGHSLADDAAYKEALVLDDTGKPEEARAVREALLVRYPEGDMGPETRFELAWQAWLAGEHARALKELDALIARGPRDAREGLEGRAEYWRARCLAALGKKRSAADAYAAVVDKWPLSYHAQQALSRLGQLDAARAHRALSALRDTTPLEPLRFPERSELHDPRFGSALSLLQVDELELAKRELSHLGATGSGTDNELLWIVAALYHGAHAYQDASRIARDRLGYFMELSPRGPARHLWRIAFPLAYAPLIEEAATEAGVPASYVRAVAREESGFNPEAVSSANAYGLIQLIRPTAKSHAKALGLPSDPASLKKPEVNLRIGSSFIRYLWRRYEENPAVVPAAYNAGHGAADRWLRERADRDLDEWIESIPYSETRRYTRRVLQSYGIYAWLAEGQLPALGKKLP